MKHARLHSSQTGADRSRRSSAVRRRFRVHLHRRRLDGQLADGLAPELFHDRALRATQLARMRTRRRVARSLRRLVADAEVPPRALLGSAALVNRRSVLSCREGLLGLAERFEQPVRLDPCGVARALVLLTDGDGPFYDAHAGRSMSEAVWWVADGLQR